MSGWPTVDRDPVRLPTLPGHDDELWLALIELSAMRPRAWTLIGGQMVFLHAMENADADQRAWNSLAGDSADRGCAAFRLLTR